MTKYKDAVDGERFFATIILFLADFLIPIAIGLLSRCIYAIRFIFHPGNYLMKISGKK